jgi:phosphoenolpyruvate phosphomutase
MQAIVLAASRGDELEKLTQSRPKVMLPISGRPLLRRLVDEFKKQGINDTTVVAGYRADAINIAGVKVTVNQDYATTGELASLACAESDFTDNMLVLYGDLLFRSYVLRDLLEHDGEIVTVVDSAAPTSTLSGSPDYAWCSAPDDRAVIDRDVTLKHIGKGAQADRGTCHGRWIGMLRIRGTGRLWLAEALTELKQRSDYHSLGIPQVLNHLIEQGRPVRVVYISGHWLDVNSLDDLDRAGDFTQGNV